MNKTQIKLSAVIITFNEEKNIERCLKSIQQLADEIIVVDSFSNDSTEDICKKFNVKFIKKEFSGFIQQKNDAIAHTSHDYILSIDADESLSPELYASILELKNNWAFDGYIVNRITNYCGKWIKHSGWYPDKKLRLFNKQKGEWSGNTPHEIFKLKNQAEIPCLQGNLYHYSFYTIEQHLDTINKYSTLAAINRFSNGIKSSWIKILIHPIWKFFRNYILKLGFLDGFYGFIICKLSAYATFVRYVKLKKLWDNAKSQ